MAEAVSREVLDRLRWPEALECWNRDELDPMLELYAEDAVMDVSAVFTDISPLRGHGSMRRYWMELRETWGGGMRLDPIEVLDAGNGRFVVDLRLSGKGTRSGAEVDQRFAFLYTLRFEDGKILHAQLFPDVPTAIAAAESPARRTA
jgi:ketosteroid isomerase-like protein